MQRNGILFKVSGRVQGVGFRYSTREVALNMGVKGFVTNRADGSVEVYATGTKEQLDRLSDFLKKGPAFAQVTKIDETQIANPEFYNDFYIK